MMQVPPEVLSNWPRLKTLSEEVSSLEQQHAKAMSKASQLRAQLPAAQEQDLNDAARAVREGKDGGEPTNERKVQRQLESFQRDATVLQRAVAAAQHDRDAFVARHKAELYEDVQKFRDDLATQIAEHAKAILPSYGRYEDLHYTLKDLTPPPPPVDADAGPQRLTQVLIGPTVTQRTGPDRGQVEGMLAYLVSLAASTEGGKDVAA
jgi:chromosome segregation ATPase